MNRTEPSMKAKLAPPGCMLDALWMNGSRRSSFSSTTVPFIFRNGFIGNRVQNRVSPKLPDVHQFHQSAESASSMLWARSLKASVLLVPSVIDAKETELRM